MTDIKVDLKNLVENEVLPNVEAYIEDLHKLLEDNTQTEEDMTILKEMESFMVELQNIIEAIETNKISDEQSEEVYQNMMNLINESHGSHEDEEIRA